MFHKLTIWAAVLFFIFGLAFFCIQLTTGVLTRRMLDIKAGRVVAATIAVGQQKQCDETKKLREEFAQSQRVFAASKTQKDNEVKELSENLAKLDTRFKQVHFELLATREEFAKKLREELAKALPDVCLSYDRMVEATFVIECYGYQLGEPVVIPRLGKVTPRMPFASFGSGISIMHNGTAVLYTAAHAVAEENRVYEHIIVTFRGHEPQEAEALGHSGVFDLARVKLKGEHPYEGKPLELDTPAVGDFVVAIGAPIGYRFAVTPGWIAAVDSGAYANHPCPLFLISTVHATNGNSGGPIISMKSGKVVGLTVRVLKPRWDATIAIPGNYLALLVDRLANPGALKHGAIGVAVAHSSEFNQVDAVAMGVTLPKKPGVVIAAIQPGGPTDGKLKVGDVITSCNGIAVTTRDQIEATILLAEPDSTLKLGVLRDGKPLECDITVGEFNFQ